MTSEYKAYRVKLSVSMDISAPSPELAKTLALEIMRRVSRVLVYDYPSGMGTGYEGISELKVKKNPEGQNIIVEEVIEDRSAKKIS